MYVSILYAAQASFKQIHTDDKETKTSSQHDQVDLKASKKQKSHIKSKLESFTETFS